jgi:hypothetical protein
LPTADEPFLLETTFRYHRRHRMTLKLRA